MLFCIENWAMCNIFSKHLQKEQNVMICIQEMSSSERYNNNNNRNEHVQTFGKIEMQRSQILTTESFGMNLVYLSDLIVSIHNRIACVLKLGKPSAWCSVHTSRNDKIKQKGLIGTVVIRMSNYIKCCLHLMTQQSGPMHNEFT